MLVHISLVAVVLFGAARAQPRPATPAEIQLAVEKGLFFVEHRSMLWWKARKCATCHEGQMLVIAAQVAKAQGVPVDQAKLDFWIDRWIFVDALAWNDKRKKINGVGGFTAPFFYLYRDKAQDVSAARAEKWTGVLKGAFEEQREDGHWDGDPKTSSHATPTMALALADLESSEIPFAPEFRKLIRERRERTENWIRSHDLQKPEKTESLAGWLLYEHERGDKVRAKQLLEELLSRRRDDGGWGMKKADPSHLLVTSVVLLTLNRVGFSNDDPVVVGTQRYLLDQQLEDGRWRELGRHFHPEAYHSAYDVWTSGFAVAALSLTMPKLGPDTKRLFTPEAALVAQVDRLTQAAAEGYQGRTDRSEDPTEPDERPVPKK